MPEEIALGGNLQDAVRIGDTVHRRAGPWTPAVHALLRYLERANFPAPRVVGMDAQGREVLRFIDGETHNGTSVPVPDAMYAEAHVVAAAKLLRRYHDVVADFHPLPAAHWRVVAPTRHEVICHNDWTPWNALLRENKLAVMLDWDLAGPGTRVWDIAMALPNWVPPQRGTRAERFRLLRLFLDSYGLSDRSEVLLTWRQRLAFIGALVAREAAAGDPGMQRIAKLGASREVFEGEIRWLDENWSALERAL